MKFVFFLAAFFLVVAYALADVANNTTWSNSSGVTVTVSYSGTVIGDLKVSYTDGEKTSEVRGTPNIATGELVDSGEATVGVHVFRASGGNLQWQNSAGSWIDLSQVPVFVSGGDTGTLP